MHLKIPPSYNLKINPPCSPRRTLQMLLDYTLIFQMKTFHYKFFQLHLNTNLMNYSIYKKIYKVFITYTKT